MATKLNLSVGSSYTISLAAEVEGAFPVVSVNGFVVNLTAGNPVQVGTDMWIPLRGTFVATSAASVLVIQNQSPGQEIMFVDSVYVLPTAAL